jgi:hypothetical protein
VIFHTIQSVLDSAWHAAHHRAMHVVFLKRGEILDLEQFDRAQTEFLSGCA